MGKRCEHENADHLGPGDIFTWSPFGMFTETQVQCEQFRCLDCGEWLSLGPARDTPKALLELRAAEIAAAAADAGEFDSAKFSFGEAVGWHVSETFGSDDHPLIRYGADVAAFGGEAGYLAEQIATHDQEQEAP